MQNRWYRRNELFPVHMYDIITYRNSAYSPLIRQIKVQYNRLKKGFIISLHAPSVATQQKILDCFKTILSETEFKNLIYCFEISIHTYEIAANSELLAKMIKAFEQIHKIYPDEIPIEVVKDIRNIFNHNFSKSFVSELPLWQDTPAYVNPQRSASDKLARLTENYLTYPNKINHALYLRLLKEGENPNQKNIIGNTILFLLADRYHRLKYQGFENHTYKLMQIMIFYGANIFYAENGIECISPAEVMDRQGYPEIFRGIIQANIRIEKPLQIKSVEQSMMDGVITTEFTFEDKKKDAVFTQLLPIDQFNKDQALVNKSYELFSQTFEDPDGSMSKVKKEFDDAFSANRNGKTLVEVIYAKNHDNKMQMIGCTLYIIYKDAKDVVLNIDYSLVDRRYRFGLMTFLDFRIGFCLALLNPHSQSAIFYFAAHLNSFEMIKREFFAPKFNVSGAERAVLKTNGNNVKTFKQDITWIRNEILRVKGGYFTKAPEDIQQSIFYQYMMGFVSDSNIPNKLIPPIYPVSAFIYAPITDEWFARMQESAQFHGFDYAKIILQLAVYLSKLDQSLVPPSYIPSHAFPKALSLFAPPIEQIDSVKAIDKKLQIKSKL